MLKNPTILTRLMSMDAKISASLRMQPSKNIVWRMAAVFAHSGDSWFWLAGLGLLWLAAGEKWKNSLFLSAGLIVLLAVIIMALKFIIRRKRPEGEWGQIYRNTDPHSFPSGHAARAALIAALGYYFLPTWAFAVLIAWAILVCGARVATGVHYLSDVLAGLVIGIAAGVLIVNFIPELLLLLGEVLPAWMQIAYI